MSPESPDPLGLPADAFRVDPHAAYARLRADAPVCAVPGPMGSTLWLVTRYEDVRALLVDPRMSKDPSNAPEWAKTMAGDDGPMGRNMLNSDPPDHTRQRRLVSTAFNHRRIEGLRPRVEEVTAGLVDAMAARAARGAAVDLIEEFAHPLPMIVICELLGIPEADRHAFAGWTRMLLASPATTEGIESRRRGNVEMGAFLSDLIATKATTVDPALPHDAQPDLLSALLLPDRGEQLSRPELLGMLKLLLVAGHETTVNHIGNAVVALLAHPEQLALLRSRPDLLPAATEELLRYEGALERLPARFTTADVEVAGTVIPRGSAVNLVVSSANRDGTVIADPDRLDIDRPAGRHFAWGHGVHFCLGMPLARIESQTAFGTLLDRFGSIELACPPEQLEWRVGGPHIMRGLAALPLWLREERPAARPAA